MRKFLTSYVFELSSFEFFYTFILKDIADLEKDLEKRFREKWNASFPGFEVRFLSGLQGGCLAANWKPEAYLYSVNGIEHCAGKWYAFNEEYSKMTNVKAPIPTNKIRKLLAELSNETGVQCRLVNSSLVQRQAMKEFDEVGSF